ncbi:hypothetical protein LEP1GSC172_1413 [Leptospira noguchii]|uniref:Uncharacterized protein n=1 Tax=Leptospira noguchii TaxID=28182 RepID=M6W0I8_9LEPT|nr:hypothetical protein LEP1GSC172_1413 [Leptospira noguchii]
MEKFRGKNFKEFLYKIQKRMINYQISVSNRRLAIMNKN